MPHKCISCSNEINNRATRCKSCYIKNILKGPNHPSRGKPSYIRTELHNKLMSRIKKRHWRENENFIAKQIKHLRSIWENPKHREFMTERFTGKKNPRWKNGIKHSGNNYILIYMPKHPNAYQNYVPQQNLIVEKYINRYIKHKEVVHHINMINDDNKPENLILFKTISAHRKFHYNPGNVKLTDIIWDGRKLVHSHNK